MAHPSMRCCIARLNFYNTSCDNHDDVNNQKTATCKKFNKMI